MTSMNDWSEEAWVVFKEQPNVAMGSEQILILEYQEDDEERADDREHCDAIHDADGAICRLWAGHGGAHIPFSVELVATTGVYVVEVQDT